MAEVQAVFERDEAGADNCCAWQVGDTCCGGKDCARMAQLGGGIVRKVASVGCVGCARANCIGTEEDAG